MKEDFTINTFSNHCLQFGSMQRRSPPVLAVTEARERATLFYSFMPHREGKRDVAFQELSCICTQCKKVLMHVAKVMPRALYGIQTIMHAPPALCNFPRCRVKGPKNCGDHVHTCSGVHEAAFQNLKEAIDAMKPKGRTKSTIPMPNFVCAATQFPRPCL